MSAIYRPGESYMGQHVKAHRPRANLNTLIHSFKPAPRAFLPSAILLQLKLFPDISFWQGDINWDVMASKTDTVIIRAGQNLWPDLKFRRNYTEAKKRGMRRGVYFFYDDRVDPGKQAALLISLLNELGLPEMKAYVDWENKYGGAFGGLRNVVAFMQAVEAALPVVVGLYSGYYFFRENTNPITHAAQYSYLKTRELWLAFYASASQVLIPAPWTVLTHWQAGTPDWGSDYGVATREIDINYANMTIAEFEQRYPIAVIEPPPNGEPMETFYLTVKTAELNIRSGAGTNYLITVPKGLKAGDKVQSSQRVTLPDTSVWYRIDKITRAGLPVPTTGNGWASSGINGSLMTLDQAVPDPAVTLKHTINVYSDGSIQVDNGPVIP